MPGVYSEKSIAVHFEQTNKRLLAIEAQLSILSEKAGVAYERPFAEIAEDVKELAREGKQLEAMKRYRELTGAGADEARDVVAGL